MCLLWLLVGTGCSTETGVSGPSEEDKQEIPAPWDISCPIWTCVEYVVIPEEELDTLASEDCYGWHTEQGWLGGLAGAPPEWLQCDPEGGEDCRVQVHVDTSYEGRDLTQCETGCAEGLPGDAVDDDCCYEEDEINEFHDYLLTQLGYSEGPIQELEDDCGIEATQEIVCEFGEGEPELSAEECDPEALARMSSADYVLEVEPLDSYLTVHTASAQDTIALSGLGVAQAGTTEFLAAIVDAQETLQLSDDYSDWRLWFGADIDFHLASGSFVVPASQGYLVKGRGKKDANWMSASFGPTDNVSGAFDNATGTWHAHYFDTFPGGWVELHLQGPFYASSIP